MRKVVIRSALIILALVVVVGGGAAYYLLSTQDRGLTRDGKMAPPASVRNAPEAPKFDAATPSAPAKTAEQAPDVQQLPTEFKLPTDLDIQTPKVPDNLGQPAEAAKG
jgi:hypothetical protein